MSVVVKLKFIQTHALDHSFRYINYHLCAMPMGMGLCVASPTFPRSAALWQVLSLR